jgi:hypothetical protein
MFSLFRHRSHKTARNRGNANSKVAQRVVQHERWVHTDQLELGMYVTELCVPWEDTGFMFQGFVLDSVNLLKQVQEASEYALVQSRKMTNISSDSATRFCRATRTTNSDWKTLSR